MDDILVQLVVFDTRFLFDATIDVEFLQIFFILNELNDISSFELILINKI